MASCVSPFCLLKLPFSPPTLKHFQGARLFSSPLVFTVKTNLSFSKVISTSIPRHHHSFISSPKTSSFTVFAHKGYKMKTHKASAKRFRVTGKGKIVRRRAGKQHLLAKKNKKRKLRLSKMV
ncbi:hypothetical protein KSP40_PGU003089 [Platanthera guangdongensis]|uniref:50S ribosomal protein L35 n=1 Tax=Platanthera guangdongensis TaxID=2320717 RepID=A0ABR2MXJ2_9ASPA